MDLRIAYGLVNEIRKISNAIILESLPIMRNIDSGDKYVDDLIGEFPNLSRDQALEVLQEVSLEWVKDAEPLTKEASIFITEGEEGYHINDTEECPILSEVWKGDAYDKSEVEGLRELLKDLKQELALVNETHLIKKAKDMLLGED